MTGQWRDAAEWVLNEDGSWRPCDRKEPLSALQHRLRKRLVLNAQHFAASRALCSRVRQRLRAQRAWLGAASTTIN